MPQQVVGPATRLSERIHVGTAEEEGLHVHLLNLEFASADFLVHPLVAGVEAPRVAAHRGEPGFLLQAHHFLGVFQAVGQRDFHLHMLAISQAARNITFA